MQLGLNQRAFVEALRSGRYEQARVRLRQGDAFCATGLMAHITGCKWERNTDGGWVLPCREGRLCAILPREYVELYALRGAERIYALNDSGMGFTAIADKIEAEPERFFRESR